MIHYRTQNTSFLDQHHLLKSKGIKNNAFFLALYDPYLENVDPFDPNLSNEMKARVLSECRNNYWYFLREVVRLPTAGADSIFEINPAFLAFHYLCELNENIYIEVPRQIGKTTSTLVRKLYEYQIKATNSNILLYHIDHEMSKANLNTIKVIRDKLPPYLRLKTKTNSNGKIVKSQEKAESLRHAVNGNQIITMPKATSRDKALVMGRGRTCTSIFFDEHAFIQYNDILYDTIRPAFETAANISKLSGNPHGIIITTTAGILNNPVAQYSYDIKENAVKWNDTFYDLPKEEIHRNINNANQFCYIKYQYYELGKPHSWLENVIKGLHKNWRTIRREYLLEWEFENEKSPFSASDIETMQRLRKDVVKEIYFGTNILKIYQTFDEGYFNLYPPLIGVDCCSTQARSDSNAITIIDSKTTAVLATFNSNYISSKEFTNVIITIMSDIYKTSIINIDTTGGYADYLIIELKALFPDRVFYTIKKGVTLEKRDSNMKPVKYKTDTKRLGLYITADVRRLLMEILYDRVANYKELFLCPILIDEICNMEITASNKIEHSKHSHDDQVFSYLIALYMWYHGDIGRLFNIRKYEINPDKVFNENTDTAVKYELSEETRNEIEKMTNISKEEIDIFQNQFTDNNDDNKISKNKLNSDVYSSNIHMPEEYAQGIKEMTIENVLFNDALSTKDYEDDPFFNTFDSGNLNNIKNSWEI